MAKRSLNLFFLVACISWAILILVLTLTPGKYVPSYSLFSYDKIGHAGIFCIQAILLMLTFHHFSGMSQRKAVIFGMMISIVYGFIIEGIQSLIPDRSMDIYDAIANITGSFFAPFVFYLVNKRIGINNI